MILRNSVKHHVSVQKLLECPVTEEFHVGSAVVLSRVSQSLVICKHHHLEVMKFNDINETRNNFILKVILCPLLC